MHMTIDGGIAISPSAFEQFSRQLHTMAERIDAGDERAPVELQRLMVNLQQHSDPRCTGLYVFASALAQRVSGAMAQTANLYLRRFEVPQIELFNLLGRCMPMVSVATRVANGALAEAMRGIDHPTLIDIGIGTGRQIVALLEQLAAAGELPSAMTVIGVEPGSEALEMARRALGETAKRLGLALSFHGFASTSEALRDGDWAHMQALCTSRPLINASFALHHIADDAHGHDQRGRVLRELAQLAPRSLVLIEPDVNHLEPRFLPRFVNCFKHFAAVFELLDALPITQAERDALKVGFFGREIQDVLGTAEHLRTERHESTAAWLRRLAEAGLATQNPMLSLPSGQPIVGHPAIGVQATDTHVMLTAGSVGVVAVLVACSTHASEQPRRVLQQHLAAHAAGTRPQPAAA